MANNGRQHDFGHWGNLAGRSPIENPELGWGDRPPPVNIEGALNRGDQFAHRNVEVPYRYRGQPSFDSPITGEQFKLTPIIKQLILDQVMLEDPHSTQNMVETFGYGAVDRVVREFLARSSLHSEQDTWVGDGPAPEYVRQGLLHEEAKRRPENNISSARSLWELMLSNVSGQDPKNVFPRYEGRNRPGITGISGINVFGGGQGVSVVPKPQFSPNQEPITERIPTSREQVKGVMDLPDEKSKAFSRIHEAYSTGADFGYESGWLERLNVPEEYIGLYMAVPDAAKKYAYENPTDAVLEQFEEKYGFPLNISIPL